MSDCDHKFVGTDVCVRCGESYLNILKGAYNKALKELNDAGKQERATVAEVTIARQEAEQLRKQIAKLTEENDRVQKSFLLSQEARTEWIKNLDAMRAQIAELKSELRCNQFEFCKECNSPMNLCGPVNSDGEPSLDCLVCQLRAEIADWKKRWEESPYPAAEVAQEQIRSLRAKVAELEELLKLHQTTEGNSTTNQRLEKQLAKAARLIAYIGTTGVERTEVIKAAEVWYNDFRAC